jgi:hypothetical protein
VKTELPHASAWKWATGDPPNNAVQVAGLGRICFQSSGQLSASPSVFGCLLAVPRVSALPPYLHYLHSFFVRLYFGGDLAPDWAS